MKCNYKPSKLSKEDAQDFASFKSTLPYIDRLQADRRVKRESVDSPPKFIKGWEDLVGLETEHFRLDINVEEGSGWIRPKDETDERHEYLSTHTFYGHNYEASTRLLQKYGFNVELDNWDKECIL